MSVEDLHSTPEAEPAGAPPAEHNQADEAPPSLRDIIGEAAAGDERTYVREGRRFVPKTKEEPAQAQPKEQAAQTWRPVWYKDEYGPWDQLGEPLRKAIEERERAAGKYQSETGQKLKNYEAWDSISEAVKPFEAQLRAQGQTPQQFIGGLVNIYGYLQSDPVQALNWLAGQTLGNGWDLRSLVQWMDQQDIQTQQADPLQQELAVLKNKLAQLEQRPLIEQRESLNKQIAEWSQGKEHFDTVRSLMASLAQSNPSATLDQLYDQACYAHPEVRPRMLEAQRKQAAEKAGNAAALNVRGTPSPGASNPTAGLSLRDQIRSAMGSRI